MDITYDDVMDSLNNLVDELKSRTNISWVLDNRTANGSYSHVRRKVTIGTIELERGHCSGRISGTNYVSMHKQCFHEYRHWQQYNQFFAGVENGGLPDNVIEHMAVQSMISHAFPNYGQPYIVMDNYLNMIEELDAEEYALVNVREYLCEQGIFSNLELSYCMQDEVNRRERWWGDRPVRSIDDAIDNLHNKKVNHKHLCLCTDFDSKVKFFAPIYDEFIRNPENLLIYSRLSDDEQDQFLIDYICKHDVEISSYYPIISDRFPNLSVREKASRFAFRAMHGLPDDNIYNKVGIEVNAQEGQQFTNLLCVNNSMIKDTKQDGLKAVTIGLRDADGKEKVGTIFVGEKRVNADENTTELPKSKQKSYVVLDYNKDYTFSVREPNSEDGKPVYTDEKISGATIIGQNKAYMRNKTEQRARNLADSVKSPETEAQMQAGN